MIIFDLRVLDVFITILNFQGILIKDQSSKYIILLIKITEDYLFETR